MRISATVNRAGCAASIHVLSLTYGDNNNSYLVLREDSSSCDNEAPDSTNVIILNAKTGRRPAIVYASSM